MLVTLGPTYPREYSARVLATDACEIRLAQGNTSTVCYTVRSAARGTRTTGTRCAGVAKKCELCDLAFFIPFTLLLRCSPCIGSGSSVYALQSSYNTRGSVWYKDGI